MLVVKDLRNNAAKKDEHFKRAAARYYNLRVRPSGIKARDLLLCKNEISRQETSRNLDAFWEDPYKVVKACGNGAYVLQDAEGRQLAKTWNDVHLKKYYP